MLDARDAADLLAARHADPFAVLGLHADTEGRLWLRALLPGAEQVSVIDAATGKPLCHLPMRHAEGLFEGAIPRRRKPFAYRLRIRWLHGETELADAYAFGPQLDERDLELLRDGNHPAPYAVLGAHQQRVDGIDGVRFAVWAPNARRISTIGTFNAWDGRRHPMRLRHAAGVWEIFIPHAALGDLYKFEITAADGGLLPAKADPYARAAELRPGTASRVAALPEPSALSVERIAANQREAPISVYEV
ncbi:MAG: hypothetical protein RLZZ537_1343, partial [Pseudomonadota bacterium]